MDLSNIKILETRKKRKRVGRGAGSGKGKTAGRGHKGQGCRSGGSVHPWFEGGQMPLYRRLPRRGFNNARFKKQFQILNVSDLNGFESGSEVKPVELYQSGLIEKEYLPVKVLGDGELTVSLTIHAHKFSKSAQEKIEKAGGKISVIEKKVETAKE